MAQYEQDGGNGARFALAVFSPIIIAAGFFVFPFLPAISAYLDGRSRTYTAAACTALGCAALPYLLGPHAYALSAFIAITTAAVYILMRVKLPFTTGLVGAAGGGVLGAVAFLGLLGAGFGSPLNVVAASLASKGLQEYGSAGNPSVLSVVAGWFAYAQQQNQTAGIFQAFDLKSLTDLVAGKSVAEMTAIVRPALEDLFAAYIPAVALVGGMLTGGLGYYLPVSALDRRRRRLEPPQPKPAGEPLPEDGKAAAAGPVPPFAAFKVPRYIVFTLLLLQVASTFILTGDNPGMAALNVASYWVFSALMDVQALSMLSYFMNRKKMPAAAQFLLLALSLLFLSCILPYVGIFDALFDARAITARMDALRSKGKQPFTPEGLEELRKMQERRRNGKNGGDGKDGGEGENK